MPNKTNSMCAQIVKQVGCRSLTATHKNWVWGNFLIYVRFSGAARSKFAIIVVSLYKRNHSFYKVHFLFFRQRIWFISGRAKEKITPFFIRKLFALRDKFIQIQIWHLNRLQTQNLKRRIFGTAFFALRFSFIIFVVFVFILICNSCNTPNTSGKDFCVFACIFSRKNKRFYFKVCKTSYINILVLIKSGGNLIDYCIFTVFSDFGFDFLAFIRPYIVFG